MSETVEAPAEGQGEVEAKFTQADMDRVVQERLAQQAKNKFGDYDDLKVAAAGARTVEQKLADLESKYAEAEARALRSDVAARFKLTAEDRDLFLTGSDQATLEAQAKRLADRVADELKNGNRAPNEGRTSTSSDPDRAMRESVRNLFGRTD